MIWRIIHDRLKNSRYLKGLNLFKQSLGKSDWFKEEGGYDLKYSFISILNTFSDLLQVSYVPP